ncbi:MAG: M48 family metallopeptidase, partial [Planctomycetes bacterium]|nr:M48 family metallopeptidase [Planctomycetota bacterium]
MDFFIHQEQARKNSQRLVILFLLAVLCIIAALYVVAMAVINADHWQRIADSDRGVETFQMSWWRVNVLAGVAAAAVLIIGGGSLHKIYKLRGGGATVALGLGGRYVNPETTDPDERRLMNVVEEMAIASGVPMPMVFVLDDEEGINAFAAGYTPNDAAVAVTLGCVRLMKRDELQGIIAHEFSHILSGDMRLNIRLIGLIHGILIIGIIGMGLVRASTTNAQVRRRDKGGGAMIFIGLALAAIGYVGVFFGRLIKAAISRQREFLADASAVDFTRNPDGIAGALKKIGGYTRGSLVLSAEGEALSHMFIADSRIKGFQTAGFLSTHPPLLDRVKRIDPGFNGQWPRMGATDLKKGETGERLMAGGGGRAAAGVEAAMGAVGLAATASLALSAESVVAQVGSPTPAHLAYGAALLESLPQPLRQAAREPARAVCLVFALLLGDTKDQRRAQLALLKGSVKANLLKETVRLYKSRASLDAAARLPLADLAAAALRQLTDGQRRTFTKQVRDLIEADETITIFEFAIEKLLLHRLESAVDSGGRREPQYYSFRPLKGSCAIVLSCLARVGNTDEEEILRAFRAAVARLPKGREPMDRPLPAAACSFAALDEALDVLAMASPVLKQRIIDALANC